MDRSKRQYRLTLKKKIELIESGQREPNTTREWAIWWKFQNKLSAERITMLHNAAAINKLSTMAGKIVVVPPERGSNATSRK